MIIRTETIPLKEALDMMITICGQTGTTIEIVRSKNRKRPVAESRFLCAYFLRTALKMPLCCIAELLNRDHTAVLHMVRNSKAWVEHQDKSFYPKYVACANALKLTQ